MRLADLFESVHGNSSAGSTSYECAMKDYSSDFMEHVDLSSMSPYDFIPLDYSSLKQSFAKVYLSVAEATNKRNVGAGILAAVLLYGSWKACRLWIARTELESQDEYSGSPDIKSRRRDSPRRHDYGDSAVGRTLAMFLSDRNGESKDSTFCSQLSQTRGTETDELAVISENFQRQLKCAVSKLDDFKFRLKELESNKALLTGEIDARKQMIHKLQDEISCERERRQQAELKVEMMSMEFSQIGQLRKEVTVKSAHVNRLEKLMSEKDDLQMKLFSDNVVLPRSVVEARAKEFGELQNRVHQLQAEIDSTRRFRDFDVGCQPCRYASSVWLEDRPHPLSLPASHLSEIQVSSKKSFQTETSVALPESIMKKLPKTKLTFADRSPVLTRSMTQSVEKMSVASRSTTSASVGSHNKTPTEVKGRIDYQVLTESPSSCKTDDLSGSGSGHHKDDNLFAQIRTLIGGLKDSNIDPSNVALLTDLGTILSKNRSNRSFKQAGEKSSDEKSNSLAGLSAVSASDDSDTDNIQVRSSFTGKSHGKKGTPLKRLSRLRRDKRKDNAHLKKKLAVQYFDGQTRLLGLEDSPSFPSLSRELEHLCNEESNTHQSSIGSVGDNLASAELQSFKSCDEQRAHSGDSWILIIPKDAKREQ